MQKLSLHKLQLEKEDLSRRHTELQRLLESLTRDTVTLDAHVQSSAKSLSELDILISVCSENQGRGDVLPPVTSILRGSVHD